MLMQYTTSTTTSHMLENPVIITLYKR